MHQCLDCKLSEIYERECEGKAPSHQLQKLGASTHAVWDQRDVADAAPLPTASRADTGNTAERGNVVWFEMNLTLRLFCQTTVDYVHHTEVQCSSVASQPGALGPLWWFQFHPCRRSDPEKTPSTHSGRVAKARVVTGYLSWRHLHGSFAFSSWEMTCRLWSGV